MRTAMKLPPHILPTLEEIAPQAKARAEYSSARGVYVPSNAKEIGVYVPQAIEPQWAFANSKQNSNESNKRHVSDEQEAEMSSSRLHTYRPELYRAAASRRRFRPRARRRGTQKISAAHPFDTRRPLSLANSLRSRLTLKGFGLGGGDESPSGDAKGRKRKRKGGQLGKRRRKRRRRFFSVKKEEEKHGDHPYPFAKPAFDLPPLPEYKKTEVSRERKSFQAFPQKIELTEPPPDAPYVPKVVKELLAKMFLKDPSGYIEYLRLKERREEAERNGLRFSQQPAVINAFQARPKRKDVFHRTTPQPFSTPAYPFASHSGRYPVPKDEELSPWINAVDPYDDSEDEYYPDEFDNLSLSLQKKKKRRKRKKPHDFDRYVSSFDYTPHYQRSTTTTTTKATNAPATPPPPRTATLCICCDEEDEEEEEDLFPKVDRPRRRKDRRRRRRRQRLHRGNARTLSVKDEDEVRRLMEERAQIEREVDCNAIEPIEVVLVFDSKKQKVVTG